MLRSFSGEQGNKNASWDQSVTDILRLGVLVLLWLAGNGWSQEVSTPVRLPAQEDFHLYLLFGQSNMAGRGKLVDEHDQPHPRVLEFTSENTWAPATEPLHFDVPKICGAGIGASFAEEMAKADTSVTIGLVPCAYSGASLEDWRTGGVRFEAVLVRAKAASKSGVIKGILWHQGETDGGEEALATSYLERLELAITEWREALGAPRVPVVAGKLCESLPTVGRDGKTPRYRTIINEQIDALVDLGRAKQLTTEIAPLAAGR